MNWYKTAKAIDVDTWLSKAIRRISLDSSLLNDPDVSLEDIRNYLLEHDIDLEKQGEYVLEDIYLILKKQKRSEKKPMPVSKLSTPMKG